MQTHPEQDRQRPLVDMDVDECYARLADGDIGRVAMALPDGPSIVPVNYILDGRSIVVRTAPYTQLAGHRNGPVAFEVDDIEPEFMRGWSVVVVGHAFPMEDAEEMIALRSGGRLKPWAAGSRNLYIKIVPDRVTGRRIL